MAGTDPAGPVRGRPSTVGDIDVLFVCTANINRSAMAEGLLARRLARAGIDSVRVGSAGLLEEGKPASANAVATLAARGVDLRGHRSRRLAAPHVANADLVLAMERRHLRHAAVLTPGGFDRTFTVKEFVRRALGGPGPRGETRFEDWLAILNTDRDPGELMAEDERDTVPDPVGKGRDAFESCAEELNLLIEGVSWLMWDIPPDA